MRKYICDNCGKVFASLYSENGETRVLHEVSVASIGFEREGKYYSKIAEVCLICREKLEKMIKECF